MKTKKTRGRGNQTKNRAITVLLFVPVLILLSPLTSQTLGSWEIYDDTDITSGSYGLIDIYDTAPNNTTVNFYGDLADYIGTHDSSTLNFFGGEAELQAMDTSTMIISGGTLSFAEARYESKINVSGLANIGSLRAEDFSEIIVTGGSISAMGAKNSGIINLYGGELIEGIHATDSGQINVYGHDLVKTTSGGYYGYGQLYGYLTDETYICVDIFDLETHDHINLITVVAAEIKIRPSTVNLQSRGRWLSCNISLPPDYDVADVNSSTVLLQGMVPPDWLWFNQKQNVVMARFPQSEVAEISQPGVAELTVTGYIGDNVFHRHRHHQDNRQRQ
jgi:hypothetical protein